MIQQLKAKRDQQSGFTLIELLIAIVVVGVLSAVVIVGVGSLTNKGEKSACQATRDAVQAASVVHYANNAGVYPTSFTAMETAGELVTSGDTTIAAATITGNGWTLGISGGGATAPVFTACT